jgi:D-alanyl-D-alanine carboxypeptidase (penicillin-binding protein 5/6)
MLVRSFVALLLALMIFPGRVSAQPATPRVSAADAIVIDGWTGEVLWSKHATARHDPASTIKLMTALVVLRSHLPMTHVVTVGADAVSIGGSTAGLVNGERMTVWNLLHGMLMPSGNDAAVALADAVGGSVAHFATLMNAEAIRLHLRDSHFLSANGFDMSGQVTSAADLARLARIDLHFRVFQQVVHTRWWTARSVDGRYVHRWVNTNRLLWESHWVDGVKTGTTPGAGACLVSSVHEADKWIIEVNLGSSEASRFRDGTELLDYGLAIDPAPPWAR